MGPLEFSSWQSFVRSNCVCSPARPLVEAGADNTVVVAVAAAAVIAAVAKSGAVELKNKKQKQQQQLH